MVARLAWALGLLIVCLVNIWAAAALYFDLPADVAPSILVAIFYLVSVVAVLFSFRFSRLALGIGFALFAAVALWWCSIKPPKTRDWQPDVAETAWTERNGGKITIHNLRNFNYRPGTPPQPHWDGRALLALAQPERIRQSVSS